MNNRLYSVLLAPHVTEKAVRVTEKHNQVVFKVARNATKQDIRSAVESLFNVKVVAVCLSNVKGKIKQFKQVKGRRNNWKKAYVSLQTGHDINVANFE